MNKTFRYIYKITLTEGSLKDHYYIGQHTTDDMNDGYKGSGRIVRNYYKKHPNDYIKEILCYCDSLEELNQKEYELIGDLYNTDDMCLNLRAGGDKCGYSLETRKKLSIAKSGSNNPMCGVHRYGKENPMYGKQHSKGVRKTISTSLKGYKHTKETRKKLSIAKSGSNNPMCGVHRYGKENPNATPTTIINTFTNEILTFECQKNCAEYLQVNVEGAFRTKFLKGLPTRVPQLQNWKIINIQSPTRA